MDELGFEIDYLPVGEKSHGGNAIALRFGKLKSNPPEQTIIVIDGGYADNGDALYKLITERYDSKEIDLIVCTHPDKDHASGLYTLIEKEDIFVKKILMHRPWTRDDIDAELFKDKRKSNASIEKELKSIFNYAHDIEIIVNEKNGNTNSIIEPSQGTSFFNEIVTILGPSHEFYVKKILESAKTPEPASHTGVTTETTGGGQSSAEKDYETIDKLKDWPDDPHTAAINDTSIILLFNYCNKKILFTGDAGRDGLRIAFEYADEKRISLKELDVFDIPHHGSRKNFHPSLLDYLKPKMAFLSAPKDDERNHPSQRLINRFVRKGINIYSTQGKHIRWGINAPDRNWSKIDPLTFNNEIDK